MVDCEPVWTAVAAAQVQADLVSNNNNDDHEAKSRNG